MTSLCLPRKKLSVERTKEIFKIALRNKPKAIENLKESLEISIGRCQRFINTITRERTMFQTSCHMEEDVPSQTVPLQTRREKSLRKQQSLKHRQEKRPKGKGFTSREQRANQAPFFRHSRYTTTDSQRKAMTIQQNQQQFRKTYTESFHCDTPANPHFWKLTGRTSHQVKRRWKTEADEKPGENTIGDITRFSSKNNEKAVNYLIFQLQVNIQDAKRLQKNVDFVPRS